MAILSVKNLTKKFNSPAGEFTAVDNISFELKEGEILGLLGPNGAGKTTTIDMLLGLIKPTQGNIFYFNLPFEENRQKILQKMNFSASYLNMVWRLKIIENIYTFARLYEVDDYRQKVDSLLKEFGIYEMKDKLLMDLSSGQLTRVNLCKAFINDPQVLLLDEPTAFLDPDMADLVRKIIMKRVKEQGISVLFTSHNMAEMTELCNRVIFLHHGKIIAEDTPFGLTQKIKSCRIRLFFVKNQDKVRELVSNYQYIFKQNGNEFLIEIPEEIIGQLLGRLSLAKLKYSEISIEKPTLEDYFIKVARQKYEQ